MLHTGEDDGADEGEAPAATKEPDSKDAAAPAPDSKDAPTAVGRRASLTDKVGKKDEKKKKEEVVPELSKLIHLKVHTCLAALCVYRLHSRCAATLQLVATSSGVPNGRGATTSRDGMHPGMTTMHAPNLTVPSLCWPIDADRAYRRASAAGQANVLADVLDR